jgi:hypothetical protein
MRLTAPVLMHYWYATTATNTIITGVFLPVHKHREASWGFKFIGKSLKSEQIKRNKFRLF